MNENEGNLGTMVYDHEHPCPAVCIMGVDCCVCWKNSGIVSTMADDTEPQFLLFTTYEHVARTLTEGNSKDVVHALRPMEGATDVMKDPCTYACDNDEMVFGNRNKRSIGPANKITCPRCLLAVSLA